MKVSMRFYLLLLPCFLVKFSKAQIEAGVYGINHHYIDFEPDTTVTAAWGETPTAVTMQLDMNGDNVVDFSLTVTHSNGALGSSFQHIIIEGYNGNQIAHSETDTCYGLEPFCTGTTYQFQNAKFFSENELIDENTIWGNDSAQYIRYQRQALNCIICNSSAPDSAFIGVRINQPSDTLYGWIQLANLSVSSAISRFTIKDMACEMDNVGVQELQNHFSVAPNPCSNQLKVLINNHHVEQKLMIYNLLGNLVLTANCTSSVAYVDVSDLENGTYLISLQGDTLRPSFQKLVVQH